NKVVHVGRATRPAIRQGAGGVSHPAIAFALPVALAETTLRVERPRADRAVAAVPADALRHVDSVLAGVLYLVLHQQEALVPVPAADEVHVSFVAGVLPFAHQPFESYELRIGQRRHVGYLIGQVAGAADEPTVAGFHPDHGIAVRILGPIGSRELQRAVFQRHVGPE